MSKLTLLTTTNFVQSCPSTILIETMMTSFNTTFPGIAKDGYKHIIHYDLPRYPDNGHKLYMENLTKLNDKYPQDIEVIAGVHVGLRGGFLRMLDMVQTKYMVFMEHDWMFRPGINVSLKQIMHVMDKYQFVNYIRFNRRPNVEKGWDNKLFPENRISEIPLLQTKVFSNNPHILRVSKMRDYWVPIINGTHNPRYWRPYENQTGSHAGAHGIEEPLVDAARNMIRQRGWDGMHTRWGTYIYGHYGDPSYVMHMDGRSFWSRGF